LRICNWELGYNMFISYPNSKFQNIVKGVMFYVTLFSSASGQ
jgi:hypothetical protein